jgi:protein involved in polysaccharide export with SLBB domain
VNIYYQINVFGEVKSPGKYYLKSNENLANLLAMAGGPTSNGNIGRIKILNFGKERSVNLEKILKSGKKIEELNLIPGDVVIIPRRLMPALQEWSVLFSIGTLILQILIYAR